VLSVRTSSRPVYLTVMSGWSHHWKPGGC